jgi:predicted RNA methylase
VSKVSLMTGGKGPSERSPTDLYPTPYPSTQSLVNFLTDKGYRPKSILEPCAGLGHISKVLKDNYPNITITSKDKYEYKDFEKKASILSGIDFIEDSYEDTSIDWVITNPPFDSKVLLPIIKKALNIADTGVAMFLKGTFLETKNRMQFFKENRQLKYVLIFANRQPLYKNGIVTGASNAIMYCWFIWDKNYNGLPTIDWIDNSEECKKGPIY